MLNGSDTPDLESSASDRHSDASELPFADSHPAPQQGPHPPGQRLCSSSCCCRRLCVPTQRAQQDCLHSQLCGQHGGCVQPPDWAGGHPPAGLCAQQQQRVSSSHGGYGLVHKQLPTSRPAALAEAPLSAPGGPAERMAGGAQGMGLAGEPSHDCVQEWAQGGGLRTHHSAEGLPSLSRQVVSPDPAGELWRWSCILSVGESGTSIPPLLPPLHSHFPPFAHLPHHGALLVLWSMLPCVAAQRAHTVESLSASYDVSPLR